jgi:hypothetical protein
MRRLITSELALDRQRWRSDFQIYFESAGARKGQQSPIVNILRRLTDNLADTNPESIWSLTKAFNHIQALEAYKEPIINGGNQK